MSLFLPFLLKRLVSRPALILSLALSTVPLALSACAGDQERIGVGELGSIGLEVKLASGVELETFEYEVSGNDLLGQPFAKAGTADVSQSRKLKVQVGGIPLGIGYQIAISGAGKGVRCDGQAVFDIVGPQPESVPVRLECHLSRGGSILVTGETNLCPLVENFTVLPMEATVGGTIALSAEVTDLDSLPDALSSVWGSSAGSLTPADSPGEPSAQLTCSQAGDVTVTLRVSDGDCEEAVTAVVTCLEQSTDPSAGLIWNEVESNGGVPDDWAELYNAGTDAVDLSGYVIKDNDDSHEYVIPAGTLVPAGGYFVLEGFGFGLGGSDAVRLFDPAMNLLLSYAWEGHAPTTYGRCPDTVGDFSVTSSSTKGGPNDCAPQVVFNEVESSGGVPDDWAELYNAGYNSADLGGYAFKDNDDGHQYVLPAGTIVPAGAYLVLETADFGFGLGSADAVRLFDPDGGLVAEYDWTSHATTTYGRCPNGSGDFVTTASSTKGEPNDCPLDPNAARTWPGPPETTVVDQENAFPTNFSGLHYEPASGSSPAVLWGVLNGPAKLYRLIETAGQWVPEPGDYADGRRLTYPDGLGEPDSEGVTRAEWGDSTAVYISTERNNELSSVSRLSVLRYNWTDDDAAPLVATHEWDLTSQLPAVGANSGLEGITWIPDATLTGVQFYDGLLQKPYDPADYPGHGAGLLVVGVEGTGSLHFLALDHITSEAFILASVPSGHVATMGLEFDRESGQLWAICDDTCHGESTVLAVDQTLGSATAGQFIIQARFARPEGLPDSNNEGFAFAPAAECSGDQRRAFWCDDSNIESHAVRQGALACGPVP